MRWDIWGTKPSGMRFWNIQSHLFWTLWTGSLCAQSSCLTLCDPMDCSPPGSSIHGILQARILEWIAMPPSRGSSWPRDWTCVCYVSCIAKWIFLTTSATWKQNGAKPTHVMSLHLTRKTVDVSGELCDFPEHSESETRVSWAGTGLLWPGFFFFFFFFSSVTRRTERGRQGSRGKGVSVKDSVTWDKMTKRNQIRMGW